jgi:WD40 repeat protein
MRWHVLMYSIVKPNTSRGLFTRIFVASLVCSILGACSSAVSPVSGTLSSNQAKNRPFTTQDIQKYPLPDADNSGVYPVPQSRVTFVPYPVIPTEKPTPYATPTPVVHWNSDAIEVSWNSYSTVGQPEWLDDTIAKLAVYSAGFSDGYVTVDLSEGKHAKAKAASVHSDLKSHSPKRTYVIECKSVMQMYRANDDQLISIAAGVPRPPTNNNCSRFIHWSPDESAASFINANHDVYVWPNDGTGPRKVFEHAYTYSSIAWSPDSQKLAVERSETASHIGTINVIDVNGELLDEFQIQVGGDGGAAMAAQSWAG